MTSVLVIQRQIRRALQVPIYNAALAADYVDAEGIPLIQWKGLPFDIGAKTTWMAVEIGFGPTIVHEVGAHPMMEASGHVTVVCRSPLTLGEDGNDTVALIVDSAYPYASGPTFDGVSVNIDKSQHRGYGSDGPWLTGTVVVDWNVYRRS